MEDGELLGTLLFREHLAIYCGRNRDTGSVPCLKSKRSDCVDTPGTKAIVERDHECLTVLNVVLCSWRRWQEEEREERQR